MDLPFGKIWWDQIKDIFNTALTLVSLILAIVFYRKQRKIREPLWDIKTSTLIEDNKGTLQDLDVKYRGLPVSTLSVSKFVFWNNGRETINREDIPSSDPLRVEGTDGVQILDVKILETNNGPSQFLLTKTDTNALIDFEYMDKGHGMIFQIIHTGTSREDVTIKGSIKGSRPPKLTSCDTGMPLILAVGGLIFFVTATVDVVQDPTKGMVSKVFHLTFGLLIVLLICFQQMRAWRYSFPRGLEVYHSY